MKDADLSIEKNNWAWKYLKDAVFIGHLIPDLDAVASAIGAAALYGGNATIPGKINSETEWALKKWGLECPPLFDDYYQGENADKNCCLVDHNSKK